MAARLVFQPGLREQLAQIAIAGTTAYQQQQLEGPVPLGVVGDPGTDTEDRLDALATGRAIELDPAKDVAAIGQRQCALAVRRGRLDQVIDADDRVADRIFGTDPKVDKSRRRHPAILPLSERCKPPSPGVALVEGPNQQLHFRPHETMSI